MDQRKVNLPLLLANQQPFNHNPTMLHYPGSKNYPWYRFAAFAGFYGENVSL